MFDDISVSLLLWIVVGIAVGFFGFRMINKKR